jgi:hypothetical protein
MPSPPQLAQITCPNCKHVFRAEIYSLVDPALDQETKHAMLAGHLNIAECSACGMVTMIATPIAYHDGKKQLFFICIPQEITLSPKEEERFIGEISNALISNIPADAPRAYLLTPRRFMSLSSMVDVILEADGIPREVVEQQRNQINLISSLVETLENDDQLRQLVEQHKEEINDEFLIMLSMFIDVSVQQNQQESAQLLMVLRDKLVEITGIEGDFTHDVPDMNRETVFERLEQATDEQLEEVIAEVRPMIDYSFFQQWTARIESLEQSGNKHEAQRLYKRRTDVSEMVERLDKEAQAIFEQSAHLLRNVIEASDPRAVMEEQSDEIGEAFMLLIAANLESASRSGQHEMVARLQQINELTIDIIQSKLPPEERFINKLLLAETAQERSQLFHQNADNITTDFVKKLNELAEEQEKRGLKEASLRLRQLAREASALLF